MGFKVLEGYGLTETTGPITLPDPDHNVIGSVGPAVPGNEAKIKNINDEGIGGYGCEEFLSCLDISETKRRIKKF
ncbi:MAG: AMP-binding protein [Comamonadaceae bacterium]|nr:AMP-binding protein [Comamonadaceae bacterium]